ncbi:uncharacterized protein (TIGR02058 family) [Bradyrhizobium sp. GM24.11]
MFERKSRYRNARLKTTRDKTLLRCRLVAPATVPTNKPDPQFLIFVCHHKVSTYFGGHLMHQSTQKQKVQGNSRLRMIGKTANDMFVDVTIGVPNPEAVDKAAVAKELPYGTVTVTAVKGGLEIPSATEVANDPILIANAAVIVSFDKD